MGHQMDEQDRKRQAFFNQGAKGWLDKFYKNPDTDGHDLHQGKIGQIIQALGVKPDHRILDLGCGPGVLVPYLLEKMSQNSRLVEMDYAPEMIEANKNLNRDKRISFECAHVMDMPFEKAFFDRVICFACFPHFQDQQGAVKAIARVLKPEGRLVIAHLLSSDEIASHHKGHTPVSEDRLPPLDHMAAWLSENHLEIKQFTDMPGFYCLAAVKGSG